jgi:hypothetical protein
MLRIRFTYSKLLLENVTAGSYFGGQRSHTYGSEQQIVTFIKLPLLRAEIYWPEM